ncbi:MAG: HAD hydrolase-like protein [Eubacterium sp.]|nr:HAD hydrolase-like protein [Eubacterium sp.]
MIKSVIFDLDGTLLDTGLGVIATVKKMIKKFGYRELNQEELETFIGPPVSLAVERLYGVSHEEAMEAMTYFRQEYPKGDIYKADYYEGLEELLKDLLDKGYRVGVATYKREDMAISLLEDKGLAKYFDVIHGSNIAANLTKADVVKMTIDDLGFSLDETVMIGDSDNDAIGADTAGVHFIGVTYGYGFRSLDAVAEYPNIGIAENPGQVLEIIENYNK